MRRPLLAVGTALTLVGALVTATKLVAAPATAQSSATAAAGTNYYVSPGGSDKYDGRSPERPVKTLNHAAGLTQPGDVVNLMDGRYDISAANTLTVRRSGTAAAPIVYRAQPDGNAVRPVLFAGKDSRTWNVVNIQGASHIVIEGLEIQGDNARISLAAAKAAKDKADPQFNTNGVNIGRNATHITVRDNLVHHLPGCGICAGDGDADYVTIENNVVHSTSWFTRYATSGISLLELGNSDSATGYKNFVRNNVVHNNKTQVEWEAIGKLSDGNGIIIDSLRRKKEPAKTYRAKTLVSDNVVYDNGGSGIHCYFSNNVDIVHNTGYHNAAVLDYGNIFLNSCENSRLINNVSVARDGRSHNGDNNRASVQSHNVYHGGNGKAAKGTDDVFADPRFNDAATHNFRLRAGSPAIGTARPDVVPAALYGAVPNRADRGARVGPAGGGDTTPTPTPTSPPTTPASGGLRAEYYNTEDFTGKPVTRTEGVNLEVGTKAPVPGIDPDTFSVRWTGTLAVTRTGTHTFHSRSDDGFRLWVDGKSVIDNWTLHSATDNNGTIQLTAGTKATVKVEYYEHYVDSVARLELTEPGSKRAALPLQRLAPPAVKSVPPKTKTPAKPSTKPAAAPASGSANCPGRAAGGQASTAVNPTAASYLGIGKDDAANAVEIGAGCTVVVGGRFNGALLAKAVTLPGGGAGAVLRFDSTGRKLVSASRVAGTVDDLEVRRTTGDIAVATDKGVRVLDGRAAAVRWKADGVARRVAIGDAGTVAALSGTTVRIYNAAGKVTGTVKLAGKTVNDVAVDDRTGHIFVTGFTQYGGPCKQVQIPFVRAYGRTGVQKWKLYDFGPKDIGDLCADSRGDRVAMGRDGQLYFAGEMAGGNTVFSKNGRSTRVGAPNVGYDKFTQAFNTRDAHLTYFARFDPATGAVKAGQTLLARIDVKGDLGNTIKPRAITADAQGRIYVGGVSAYQLADRDKVTMNGRRLKAYAGGDAWVLVTSPDLKKRLLWTSFTDGGKGEVRGLAASGGVAALAARVDKPAFHTHTPVQPAVPSTGGGYAAVWPTRS